jgi:hypothetical protein
MMIELGIRKKIELEKTGQRKRSICSRKVVATSSERGTGDVLLDEALKYEVISQPPCRAHTAALFMPSINSATHSTCIPYRHKHPSPQSTIATFCVCFLPQLF